MNFELTIPRNTTENNPVIYSYDYFAPVINGFTIRIPDGNKFLARLNISNYGQQIIPVKGSGVVWLRGNNQIIHVLGRFTLEGPPWRVNLKGWNEDDTYSHTFYIDTD
jgi:hypothetical protein